MPQVKKCGQDRSSCHWWRKSCRRESWCQNYLFQGIRSKSIYTYMYRPVGGGEGGEKVHAPPPSLFGRKFFKKEDYHFTVKNTELITQGNSPFDLKKCVIRANFFLVPSHFQIRSYRPDVIFWYWNLFNSPCCIDTVITLTCKCVHKFGVISLSELRSLLCDCIKQKVWTYNTNT